VKRVKPVRNAAVVVRVFPEERDILRFNAALHGMSMSPDLPWHPPAKNAGRETAAAGAVPHRREHQPACEMGQHL